jgi:hypothetical protein
MTFAHALVLAVELYLAVGLAFGLFFAWRWVERVDPSAHSGTWGFRCLIVPGCTALWPWLALRLLWRGKEGRA